MRKEQDEMISNNRQIAEGLEILRQAKSELKFIRGEIDEHLKTCKNPNKHKIDKEIIHTRL